MSKSSKRAQDAERIEAFSNLESAIENLRGMASVMQAVMDDVDHCMLREGSGFESIRKQVSDFDVYLMTKDQSRSLDYAHWHVYNLICQLYERYFEALEGKPEPAEAARTARAQEAQ